MYVHPVESAMVQQQLIKKGTKVPPLPMMLYRIGKKEGLPGWYRGITASLMREMIYSSLRFGLYEPFRDFYARLGPVRSTYYVHKYLP